MLYRWRGECKKWSRIGEAGETEGFHRGFKTPTDCVFVVQKMRPVQVSVFPKSLHPEVPGGCKNDECWWWRQKMTNLSIGSLSWTKLWSWTSPWAILCSPLKQKSSRANGTFERCWAISSFEGPDSGGCDNSERKVLLDKSLKLARYVREIFVCKYSET